MGKEPPLVELVGASPSVLDAVRGAAEAITKLPPESGRVGLGKGSGAENPGENDSPLFAPVSDVAPPPPPCGRDELSASNSEERRSGGRKFREQFSARSVASNRIDPDANISELPRTDRSDHVTDRLVVSDESPCDDEDELEN